MPNPKLIALGLTALGGVLVTAGASLIWVPAGFIVAGALLAAVGLLGVDYE